VYYDDSEDDMEDFQLRSKKILKVKKIMKVSFIVCCCYGCYIILWFAVAQLVEVSGSIFNGATGIFHLLNPSGRTMAPRSTQPLTEVSTRAVSWG
jgi:hypothetical protein